MLFGILLLVLELKVTSYGALAVGGIISLIFGSLMLIDSPLPELQVSVSLVVSMVLAFTAIATFLVRLAVASQRTAPVTGAEGLVGEAGEALTPITAGAPGRVRVHGEIWQAIANHPIASGERVTVKNINGLMLTVEQDRS
jgi:membrane-bound serine protease (ClpP class)